jgi:hypothetical protein
MDRHDRTTDTGMLGMALRTPAPAATLAAPTPPPQAVPTTRRPRRPCPTTTLTGPGEGLQPEADQARERLATNEHSVAG